jgi:hypothetical protein
MKPLEICVTQIREVKSDVQKVAGYLFLLGNSNVLDGLQTWQQDFAVRWLDELIFRD